MTRARSQRKKRLAQALRIPLWYYAVIGAILVVGILLIVLSGRAAGVRTGGLTSEGDYFRGRADAPTTIYGWGNFG